jgi:hypothetical protein
LPEEITVNVRPWWVYTSVAGWRSGNMRSAIMDWFELVVAERVRLNSWNPDLESCGLLGVIVSRMLAGVAILLCVFQNCVGYDMR